MRRRARFRSVAVAASVALVAISVGLLLHRGRDSDHAAVAATFGRYLDEFGRSPDQAQQVLLSSYDGRAVDIEEAARTLRYYPATPETLPDGFARDRVYLLKMPCCTCVQTIYKNDAGTCLAMFEHVDDQPVWFGDRPTITAQCHGMPTSLVQVDDHLAATWNRQGRYITVIGARNVEQVAQLVASLAKF